MAAEIEPLASLPGQVVASGSLIVPGGDQGPGGATGPTGPQGPAGTLPTRAVFQATMTANMNLTGTGQQVVPFNSAGVNVGGYYNTSTYRWTPPAGLVFLFAHMYASGWTANTVGMNVLLRKNGTYFAAQGNTQQSSAFCELSVSCIDNANGTDYYEAAFNPSSVATGAVQAVSQQTYFGGFSLQ